MIMRRRNSDDREQPPAVLRRSPRFLQIKPSTPEDPKTPKPARPRRTRIPSPEATPLTSAPTKATPRRTRRTQSKEVSEKVEESNSGKKDSDITKIRTRRSTRGNPCADESNFASNGRRRNWELEKRVTLRVTRSGKGNCDSCEKTDKGVLWDKCETAEVVDVSKSLKGKSQKNKGKHNKKKGNDNGECALDKNLYKRALSIIEKPALDEGLPKKHMVKVRKRTNSRVGTCTEIVVHEGEMEGNGIAEVGKLVGTKRKRNPVEEAGGIFQGWTKDQELALERAYLVVKPTPHFWKKVARLVPGKSAQECFDRIHYSQLTPPQPRPRSRARKLNTQEPSLSASKLLDCSGPKVKRPRYSKQKSHLAQKAVRNMLEKQYKVEQDSEADLFSVLESTMTPSNQSSKSNLILATPDRFQEKREVLLRCQERSSTTLKKSKSRFNSSYGATLMSPPVLKQVKNKALHEKYIDQLHCRDAKRKAVSNKAEKLNQGKGVKRGCPGQRTDAIKAAKNALAFGARDAINEFLHQQAKAMSSSCDDDNCADNNDEEEGEDFL